MSEYGDADLEGMAGRVMELEGQLQEKEAIVEALNAEIDDLRTDVSSPNSSQSQTSSVPGRGLISVYHNKLQEFERAIRQRDNLIEDLTASLQQALSARDALLTRVNVLSSATLPENKSGTDEKALKDEYDLSLKHIQHEYEEKLKDLKDENRVLEGRHAKELAVFQTQLVQYKKTVETLKQELVNCATCEESVQAELSMYKAKVDELRIQSEKERAALKESHQLEIGTLNDLLKQCKLQLEDVTAKYVAISNVADSKESMEVSLERSFANAATLRQNDFFERFSATTDEFLNHRLLNASRYSSNSFLSESNQTMYETINEMGIQCQVAKQKLDEKMELEQRLTDRISCLEEQVHAAQMELQEANLTKRSYEKQLKDMKNMLDKLSSQSNDENGGEGRKEEDVDSNVVQLDCANEMKQVAHVNRKLKKEVSKLRQGLAIAWSQCAEVTQHLSQSFLTSESKFSDSFMDALNSSKDRSEAYVTTCDVDNDADDTMPLEVSRLIEGQKLNANMVKQLEEEKELYMREVDKLRDIEEKADELAKVNKVLSAEIEKLHAEELARCAENEKLKELLAGAKAELEGMKNMKAELESSYEKKMQDLRVYFEQKCTEMEKQYSEDVFSQHSKKMLEKSDSENLSDDTDMNESGELVSDLSGGKVKEDLSKIDEQNIAAIVSKYESRLDKLNRELEEAKKQHSNGSQGCVNRSCQTDNDTKGDCSILELHTDSLDFTDSSDSGRLKLLEKLSGREEFEDHVDVLPVVNTAEGAEQLDVALINIISAIENDQQFKSPDAIYNLKKTQLLCKTCIVVTDYLEEMTHYIVACEKEISSCLVKQQDSYKYFFNSKFKPLIMSAIAENDNISENEGQVEEFHFVPQLTEISALLNDDIDSAQSCENLDKRYLEKLRSRLRNSLVRFRDEIARISSSTMKYMSNVLQNEHVKEYFGIEGKVFVNLNDTENLILTYQRENEELKALLSNAEQRLFNIEKRKEIITEGYGEQDELNSFEASQELSYILDKAKSFIINEEGNESPMVQVIEELYKCIEKLIDSGKREKDDLQLQIEAADKQLRATRKFLEEQASERETERDEAAKEIKSLQEQLREKEREKERDLRLNSEMRELIAQLNELEDSKIKAENENKASLDKIYMLQNIITEREQHIRLQDEREAALLTQVEQLEEIISIQTKNQEQLAQELENAKTCTENGILSVWQDELKKQQTQMSVDSYGGNASAMRQMKTLLQEMQSYLDKRTRELELLHVCSSNLSLSQPSEDVSIREHVEATRCPSPEDPNVPPSLPLDQVLRLKEKLLKNGRAEEAALKRIKDLDMQLTAVKNQNEELQAEHEILQQTTSEQLFQIEAMRSRFEQQKQNEPFVQKQVTSKLEFQLHETNNKLQSLERVITEKELEVCDLKVRLDRTNQVLSEKENETSNVIKCKEETIKKLRDRLHVTEDEKKSLEAKLKSYERVQLDLLIDKNEEIDHLKDRLAKKDKELEEYLYSIPEGDQVQQNDQPKNSARTLSDIVSINSEYDDMEEVLRLGQSSSRINSRNRSLSNLIKSTDRVFDKNMTPVPPLDLESSDSPRNYSNDSHFEHNSKLEQSPMQIPFMSANQSGIILENTEDEKGVRQELEQKLEKLQVELDAKSQTLENIKREIEGYKENNEYLHAKLNEVSNEFHSLIGRTKKNDEIMDELRSRNKELEDENKVLNDYKEKSEGYRSEIQELKSKVAKLSCNSRSCEMIIGCLEDIVKQIKVCHESEDGILDLTDLLDKTVVPAQIKQDNKKAYEALETIKMKLQELGSLSQFKKRLEKEIQMNSKLQDTIASLQEKVMAEREQKIFYRKELEQNNEMEPQRDINVSIRNESLEKDKTETTEKMKLLSMSSDLKYIKVQSQLNQLQQVNEELMKQKDNLEMNNDILKSQIAEYEKRILELKSEFDDKNKQIFNLDKELINEKSKRRALEIKIMKNQEVITASQQEDAELISCLRKQLSTSLAAEEKLLKEVISLRQKVKGLEIHVNSASLQQNAALRNEEILTKSVEIQNKYIVLVEDLDREKKNSEKLQSSVKKLEAEKVRLKDTLGVVKEEKELLISKLTLVECKKDEIKSDFDRLKAQLKSKEEECQWMQQRVKALSDMELKQQMRMPDKRSNEVVNLEKKYNSNFDSIVQYFHSKSQRSDSRRKALIFQKRYLLCVLTGYQSSEENTLAMLARLTRSEALHLNASYRNSRRARPNFKSVVLVIISIHRMKWLICRWRLTKKVGTDVILRNVEKRMLGKADNYRTAQMQNVQLVPNLLPREDDKFDLETYLQDMQRNFFSALNYPEMAD